MDFADLKRRFDAVREASTTVSGRTFSWRCPTEGEMRRIVGSYPAAAGAGVLGRAAVLASITGWSGVVAGDYVAGPAADLKLQDGESDSPVEFSADAAALLFDVRVDWCDAIVVDVMKRYRSRTEEVAAEQKKRASGSDGR
jgi:hypothetical protein